MKTVTPEELLLKHRGEHEHAQHVAHLCDTLFDTLCDYAHFTPNDKIILHTAALLHDVGYAMNPARHVEASVHIVQQAPLRGYTKKQRDLLAAVIYLHRKNYKPILKKSELTRLRDPIHAMKLAALLCIADGLDHGHVQDCTIQRIVLRKNAVTLWVRSAWYPGNVSWALAKTALFRAVFDADIQIKERKCTSSPMRYRGLLKPDDTALEAFRTLLYSQYRTYIDNLEGACEGTDSRYLHDLRVALRRARMLFTWFKPILGDPRFFEPRKQFVANLIRNLGRARDFQVWIDFIRAANLPFKPREQKKWLAFNEAENKNNSALIRKSGKLLKVSATTRNNRALARYLRATLPALIVARTEPEGIVSFSARQLKRRLKQLATLPALSESTSPAEAHEIRKTIRKLRYFSEFAETVLPPVIAQLTRRLKKTADALGNLHDMDVHIARIKRLKKMPPPAAFLQLIRTNREIYQNDCETTYAHLLNADFQHRVQAALRKAIPRRLPYAKDSL